MIFLETVLCKELIFFVALQKGDLFDFGGVQALRAGEGLVKNGFQIVFLWPYGSPHTYKCQTQKIFKDFNLSIRLTVMINSAVQFSVV